MGEERDNIMGSKDFNNLPQKRVTDRSRLQDKDLGAFFLLATLGRGRSGIYKHKIQKHLLPSYGYSFPQSVIKD